MTTSPHAARPGEPCATCGHVDPPELAEFSVHLCSGMRPVPPGERHEFDRKTRERLLAFMDEADRCRNRAAVDARSAWIG